MGPEVPFIGATIVALVSAVRLEGRWPDGGIKTLVAAAVVVVIASASAGTSLAPLVRALGLATLMASVLAFGKSLPRKPQNRPNSLERG